MVLQILIARWCLADIIVLSAVVPLNITMTPLENGDKSTVSHSSCPLFHCCLLAPMSEYLVKFNPSQRREAGFRAVFPNTAFLLRLWKKAGFFLEISLILGSTYRNSTHGLQTSLWCTGMPVFLQRFQMDI